jgi:site-specific DNA recombinase
MEQHESETICAIYARYSSEQQRPASIDDQIRKCCEYAERNGWRVDPRHFYTDEALSGVGSDRPGFSALLRTALNKPRSFTLILVDDTSRLSRSLVEAVKLQQQMTFEGIRIVAVSQGIDSLHEQAELLFAIHGIVDSLYVKEIALKTHRGLEGLALKGFHTGGRCYGYRTVKADDGYSLEVFSEEAAIVRPIFELYASGLSLKKTAARLTDEKIPRPRTGKRIAKPVWVYTCVREMLRRELYIGKIVWNRSRYLKNPGTNKRVSRPRPEKDWISFERPELRIISDDLWNRVQIRIRMQAAAFGNHMEGSFRPVA